MLPSKPAPIVDLLPVPGTLKKCLVIGAGVAGLQVARALLKTYRVLVLEASNDIGGVWTQNYVGFSLQVPWRSYQFPDFLWPAELQPADEYPSGPEVQRYIRAYADHFGLRAHIRLNAKVLRLRWQPPSRQWEALYADTERERFFKVLVDYVVVCTGIYSTPFIPHYTGAENFAGVQLHAKDFTDVSAVRGRRVLIVGAGKTALDCVCSLAASRTAASVTMLYRQAHWPMPRTLLGVGIRRLLFNRATPAMLPPYYTAGRVGRAVDAATRPLKRLFWRGLEAAISAKLHITETMRPHVGLPSDLFYGGQILDDSINRLAGLEGYTAVRGEVNSFVRNGVILQDGSFLGVDVVLYCTGYEKTYEYFDSETRSRLGLQKDGLYLYRNCLPCGVPHLAFVGSEVSTYNNILTHGLQALWLASVLSGRVKLPPPADMAADIRAQERWRRKVMPPQRSRGAVLMLYGMAYHDQLLRDLGAPPRRKGLNLLAECFGTYSAEDYGDLLMGAGAGKRKGRAMTAAAAEPGAQSAAAAARAEVGAEADMGGYSTLSADDPPGVGHPFAQAAAAASEARDGTALPVPVLLDEDYESAYGIMYGMSVMQTEANSSRPGLAPLRLNPDAGGACSQSPRYAEASAATAAAPGGAELYWACGHAGGRAAVLGRGQAAPATATVAT